MSRWKKCGIMLIALINLSMFCSFLLYLKTMNLLEFDENNTSFIIKIPSEYFPDLSTANIAKINFSTLSNVSCLIWPRIPKTGGENLLNSLRYLIPKSKRIITEAGSAYDQDKHYAFAPQEKYDQDMLTYEELIEYYEYVINHRWSKRKQWNSEKANANLFVLQYHAPFISIDLSKALDLRINEWRYISMIRHPIDRIVSSFYYLRGESGGWRALNDSAYFRFYVPQILKLQNNYNIDECVVDYMEGDNICQFSTNYYVKWFCGGKVELCDPLKINQSSYELAIGNIDKYFAWIGVMEYYEQSVYGLYDRFPLFFGNFKNRKHFGRGFEFVERKMKENREETGYGRYQKPSKKSVDIMEKKNYLDVKLYNYVVDKYII